MKKIRNLLGILAATLVFAAIVFAVNASAAETLPKKTAFYSTVSSYDSFESQYGEDRVGNTFYQSLLDVKNYLADKTVNDDGTFTDENGDTAEAWIYVSGTVTRTRTDRNTSWFGMGVITGANGKVPLIHVTSYDTASSSAYGTILNQTKGAYLCNVETDLAFEKIKITNQNTQTNTADNYYSAYQAQFQLSTATRLTFGEDCIFKAIRGDGTASSSFVIWCGASNTSTTPSRNEVTVLSGTWSNINFLTGYNADAAGCKLTVGGNATVTNLCGCHSDTASTATIKKSGTLSGDAEVVIGGSAKITNFRGALGSGNYSYANTATVSSNLDITVKENAEITNYYGGTCQGTLTGNVTNRIQGGTVTNFYGAGLSGTVSGKVTNLISGGTVTNFYGGQAGDAITGTTYRLAQVTGGIENRFSAGAKITNEVIGGSKGNASNNVGCSVESDITTVINGGDFGYSVYGAGDRAPTNGNVTLKFYGDPGYGTGAKDETQNRTVLCSSKRDVNARICGGAKTGEASWDGANTSLTGHYGYVKGNVTVDIDGGWIWGSLFAMGNADVTGTVTVTAKNTAFRNINGTGFQAADLGGVSSGGDLWGSGSITLINCRCTRLGAIGYRTSVHGNVTVTVAGTTCSNILSVSTPASGQTYTVTGTTTLVADLSEYDQTLPSNITAGTVFEAKGGSGVLTIPDTPFTFSGITGTVRVAANVNAKVGETYLYLPADAAETSVIFIPASGATYFDPSDHTVKGRFAVAGNSIRVADDFALRYYFAKETVDALEGGFKVYFSRDGETYEEAALSQTSVDSGTAVTHYYTAIFTGISPKNLGDTVYMKTNADDAVDAYSVAEACRTVLAGDFSDSFKNFAKALLNYGAAAQIYFGHDAENPVIAPYYDLNASSYTDGSDRGDDAGKTVHIRGTSVIAKDLLRLNFYVSLDAGTDPEGLVAFVNDTEVDELTQKGAYYVFSWPVSVLDARELVTAQIRRNGEAVSNTYTDSVASYCAAVRDREEEAELQELADRMMAFVDYAALYLEEENADLPDVAALEQSAAAARAEFGSAYDAQVYYVGPTRANTSFIALLLDLADNTDPKTIYLDEGTYDIFAEYMAEVANGRITVPPDDVTSPDYFGTYNAFVPHRTRIVGLGNVTLQFTPAADQISYGASRTWSPLNIYGSVMIENLTVLGKNCRYCLHNDDHNRYTGTFQYYKNVKFEYQLCDTDSSNRLLGFNNTIGFGVSSDSVHLFENCEIYFNGEGNHSAYYGHNPSAVAVSTIVLKDCYIHASDPTNNRVIRLQTLTHATPGHVYTLIDNCRVNGGLMLHMYYADSAQSFDVVVRDTERQPVTVAIASGGTVVNPYRIHYID